MSLTMSKGPQGQSRPADVIGSAVKVGKLATHEIKETLDSSPTKPTREKATSITKCKNS